MKRSFPLVLAGIALAALVGVTVTFAVGVARDDGRTTVYLPAGGMMGGGMMGPDATFGGMIGGPGFTLPQSQGALEPLGSMEEAAGRVESWLGDVGFQDFAPAEVMAFSNGYYVAVDDSEGAGAFELLVDPATGWISPEPGPNMMWNTDYGMMGGRLGAGMIGGMMGMMGGNAGEAGAAISAEEARVIADDWLERVLPGEKAETAHAFPGYYTFDTERDGQVQGMLSVNATTGAVWYHVWHGSFLGELGL
jgi:hypothetical protein